MRESIIFNRLDLAVSEKQIPQFVVTLVVKEKERSCCRRLSGFASKGLAASYHGSSRSFRLREILGAGLPRPDFMRDSHVVNGFRDACPNCLDRLGKLWRSANEAKNLFLASSQALELYDSLYLQMGIRGS